MTDPVAGMKPMDLSRWGIENPILSIVSAETESGKGLKVEVDAAKWCQAFEIDDAERLAKFNDNAKYEYYIRILYIIQMIWHSELQST